MSIQNIVTATLSDEAKARILDHLMAIKAELPFLITLAPDQMQSLTKAGNGRAPLIEKAYAIGVGHAEVFPPFISFENFGARRAMLQPRSRISARRIASQPALQLGQYSLLTAPNKGAPRRLPTQSAARSGRAAPLSNAGTRSKI